MSKQNATPRRERVERNIYRRPTGVLEIGYRDGAGAQRYRTVDGGIMAARKLRDDLLARRGRGERTAPNTRLRFGDAADRYLAGPVADLRETTRAGYTHAIDAYLRPRFATRRLDSIDPDDLAALVRELRAAGKSEATTAAALGALSRIYKYATRRLGFAGTNPATVLLASERPKPRQTKCRAKVFEVDQDTQTLAAMESPYRTLFTTLALTGARISEALALTWADLNLADPDDASIAFRFQVPRRGSCPDCGSAATRARGDAGHRCPECGSTAATTRERLPLKTEGSERTVPIPRGLAAVLAAHKLASDTPSDDAYVFATGTGRPLSQRNVNRALRAAQRRATAPDGSPTFPALHIGTPVPRGAVPSPHSFRHTLASRALLAGESVDEVAFLLGHRDGNVTRAVYVHEIDNARRRAMRRARIASEYSGVLDGCAVDADAPTALPTATVTLDADSALDLQRSADDPQPPVAALPS